MAINNSYKDNSPRTFQFLKDIVGEAYPQMLGLGDIDSTNTVAIKINSTVQRNCTSIIDLVGTIYNSAGAVGITPTTVAYSKTGPGGPWTSAAVLSEDPAYSLPDGDADGDPFDIVVRITEDYAGPTWFQIIISWNNQQDVAGPLSFEYLTPAIQLSPRRRGLTDDEHFLPSNAFIALVLEAQLDVVTEAVDDNVKGPLTLTFSTGYEVYKIPYSLASLVGPGYNDQVVWRFRDCGGVVRTFRYYKESPKVDPLPLMDGDF